MHLEFFHHKINELYGDLKELEKDLTIERASFHIAEIFKQEMDWVLLVVIDQIEEFINELIIAVDIIYPYPHKIRFLRDSGSRNTMRRRLFAQWKAHPRFRKLHKELEYLKNADNVKKFIETLEELRGKNSASNRKPKSNY